MRINVVNTDELSDVQVSAWSELQQADRTVANPCFRPEFAKAVAAVRSDVEIAVMEEAGRAVGFLPFQRERRNIGRPVGSIVSDMNGAIVAEGVDWDPVQVLRQCRLVAWHFDHLVASQKPFQPYHQYVDDSPYLDLSAGFEAYLAQRRSAGCSTIAKAQRKGRKLAREFGPLRFEIHTGDPAALSSLIRWKREQIHRRAFQDIFKFEWVINLLAVLQSTQSEAFAGLLSALYTGDQLIAVHLGLRSYDVISSSIPAFNPSFSKYSPGTLIHLELARAAAELQVTRIDLGRGANEMKMSLGSGAFPLAIGCVDRRPVHKVLRNGWYRLRHAVQSSPMAKGSLRAYRRVRNWTM